MLQIRLLGQFDVRLDGKRIVISSRAGQSLLAYLAMTAGTPHRREKLAGILWPDSSDENARKNLRQELWRIRKAIPAQKLPEVDGYLIADEFTLTFNRDADYWLDVSILEKSDSDVQSLTSSLSLYQGELLPGFYDDWVVLEREWLQTLFESKMEQLVEKLVESERWTAVQEQCERWLALGFVSESAYRALMLSYNARGDMAKVSAIYQRCVEDLRDHFGVEPSAKTHALFNGLRLHRHLTEAAYEWELLGRDPGALYRGAHLAQARAWAELHFIALNAGERTFLTASIDQEKREKQEREEARQRELAAAKELAETQRPSASRLRIRNRVITTVGSIALILALLAGMFGVQSNRHAVQAETNFKQAEAQRLALEANRLLSSGGSSEQIALLSLRSMNTHYTHEGDTALTAAARLEYPVKSYHQASPVLAARFSPDGNYLLSGDENKTVKLWDVQSGQELLRLTGHGVLFTRDGKHILTLSVGEDIGMWETVTGQEVYRITTDVWNRGMMIYSNDGKTIWTSSEDRRIRRWDAASGGELGVFLEMPEIVWLMAISPDDRYLLTTSNNNPAQLWDLQTGQEIREFPFNTSHVLFSQDGTFLVQADRDGDAHVWDVKTGQEVRTFSGHTAPIFDMAISADNQYLLTSSGDRTVRLWDMHTGQELRRFNFPVFVAGLDFSPDGEWVVTGADDEIVRLWALQGGPSLFISNHGADVTALDFSPDGKSILTGGRDGIARLWDAATGEILHDFAGHTGKIIFGATFSPDGEYIATGGVDAVRIWDTRTGEEVHQFVAGPSRVKDVRFSPDGKHLLTTGTDGVYLWDARTAEKIRQFGRIDSVQRVTFSPDGKHILTAASGTGDGKAQLWDASTGQLIREYQSAPGPMNSVDFSPDMKYVIADSGYENDIRLWDLQTGKELRRLIGHTGQIITAVFSPDGKTIATASIDNTARLWDVETGEELRRFIGHTAAVRNVAVSPHGKHILTGSDDGTAMLWDMDYHTTMDYLCSRLLRDFTEEERAQYGITDHSPTCPAK